MKTHFSVGVLLNIWGCHILGGPFTGRMKFLGCGWRGKLKGSVFLYLGLCLEGYNIFVCRFFWVSKLENCYRLSECYVISVPFSLVGSSKCSPLEFCVEHCGLEKKILLSTNLLGLF